jgi:hypothetical protein
MKTDKFPKKYPFVMCFGDAYTPQRFWRYVVVKNVHAALHFDQLGFVISNRNPEEIRVSE